MQEITIRVEEWIRKLPNQVEFWDVVAILRYRKKHKEDK